MEVEFHKINFYPSAYFANIVFKPISTRKTIEIVGLVVTTDQGRIDVLVHPAMRGLLHWKYETFGERDTAPLIPTYPCVLTLRLVCVLLAAANC